MPLLKNISKKRKMVTLDTNLFVRFFTNDISRQAALVKKLLVSGQMLYVPDAVFPEIEYVLETQYSVSRNELIVAYEFILGLENVKVNTEAKQALAIYKASSLDMADCLIAAYSIKGTLASFDKKLLKLREVTPYWK